MKKIRSRLTYANVMSSLAVFLVLGGATAFAATELGKNTVGTKQLKKNAVTTAKIKKEAVAAGKIKNGAVGNAKLGSSAVSTDKIADGTVSNPKIAGGAVDGSKVQDGSLTGTDVNQSTLNAVKASNVYGVSFQEVGGPKIINASDPGIKSGGCFLACSVVFPRDVSECSYTVSSFDQGSGSGEAATFEAFQGSGKESVLVVAWDDEGGLIAHDFAMTVVCPTAT